MTIQVSSNDSKPSLVLAVLLTRACFLIKKSGGSNGGQKLKPPKAAAKQSSSNPEELEIEIAEVLYGLMTQSQAPSSKKEDSREVDRSNGDVKPHISSPISNSNSASKQILGPNSSPLQPVGRCCFLDVTFYIFISISISIFGWNGVVNRLFFAAPKRKRPRQLPENSNYGSSAKLDMDKTAKSEISPPNLEKISASNGENVSEIGGNSVSQGPPSPEPTALASAKMNLELKAAVEGLRERRDSAVKKVMSSLEEKKSTAVRNEDIICMDTTLTATATASASATIIKA